MHPTPWCPTGGQLDSSSFRDKKKLLSWQGFALGHLTAPLKSKPLSVLFEQRRLLSSGGQRERPTHKQRVDRLPPSPRVSEKEDSPDPRGSTQLVPPQQHGEVNLRPPLAVGSVKGQGQPVAKRKEAVCATRTEAGQQHESKPTGPHGALNLRQ